MCESITLVYKLCFYILQFFYLISFLGTAIANSATAKILNINFVENVPCRDLGLLLSFVWFYDGPNWPPTLCTKFELDTFSYCINIKEKPQIFGSFPSPGPRPLFLLGLILWWPLTNPSCVPNLKSLASAFAEILKGNPKILWSFPSPGPRPLFFWVWFYDGPWRTQAEYQIWSR